MVSDTALQRAAWLLGSVLAVGCGGCVTEPTEVAAAPPPVPNTTVYFYPARGQAPEQQDRDKYECNNWAVQQSKFDPSQPQTPPHLRVNVVGGPPPGAGVATGAVTGALFGAAVSRPWESGQGALIGGLIGAAIGGIAESAAAEQRRQQAQAYANGAQEAGLEQKSRDFRRAMSACLEGRGYNVR